MTSTAHPLHVTPDGRLAQQDRFAALLGMLQVMAGTSTRVWPHAPWFGLFEAFSEAARRDRQDHEGLKDAINHALRQLGVADFEVQSLSTGAPTFDGKREFRLSVRDPEGRIVFGEFKAGG
jgi:hypothetical protein